jgi:hypothetical protein
MFEDYLRTFENPEMELEEFMRFWKENIINNKKSELSLLDNGRSLEEMVALSEIQQANNIKEFSADVDEVGEYIKSTIRHNLKE